MANLNSAQYTAIYVNKYPADARDLNGRVVPIPFDHVVGADVNTDTVNLCVLPARCKVIGLDVANSALGASTTLSLGDAGSGTRYLAATAVTTAGKNTGLLSAGQNYEPTTDTIVLATWGGANPTAAGTISGVFYVIPAV